MRKLFIVLSSILVCAACKSPEARKPISSKTGSFIDQSVERNIKLNERETERIKQIMTNNPDVNYIASESGFWYYYNKACKCYIVTKQLQLSF